MAMVTDGGETEGRRPWARRTAGDVEVVGDGGHVAEGWARDCGGEDGSGRGHMVVVYGAEEGNGWWDFGNG